jgi:hypothetical protein
MKQHLKIYLFYAFATSIFILATLLLFGIIISFAQWDLSIFRFWEYMRPDFIRLVIITPFAVAAIGYPHYYKDFMDDFKN